MKKRPTKTPSKASPKKVSKPPSKPKSRSAKSAPKEFGIRLTDWIYWEHAIPDEEKRYALGYELALEAGDITCCDEPYCPDCWSGKREWTHFTVEPLSFWHILKPLKEGLHWSELTPTCQKECLDEYTPPWVGGAELVDYIMTTCFLPNSPNDDCVFPQFAPGVTRGLFDFQAHGTRFPRISSNKRYFLIELDDAKSKRELIAELERGLQLFYTEKLITRRDSVRDKLNQLTAYRLHRTYGGFTAVQRFLKARRCTNQENHLKEEKTFYRNVAQGRDLVASYREALQQWLKQKKCWLSFLRKHGLDPAKHTFDHVSTYLGTPFDKSLTLPGVGPIRVIPTLPIDVLEEWFCSEWPQPPSESKSQ